jgi:hypothetical protein|tara:strand:- start:30 stop:554 length:525 start_codon:yes stop_codon:yes gene_type:complete
MSKILLSNVRLSFPSLFRKAVFNGDETKFEATFLINKATQGPKIKDIKAAIDAAIKDGLKGAKLPPDKICLKDGDDIDYAGYAGHMSLKASSTKRPMVLDRDKSPLTEADNKLYAGCYVNASLELWVQNNQYGKRINCNLLGVQFMKDGEPFADGVKGSLDDFEAFADDENDFL